MSQNSGLPLDRLVEPDRVHRTCYTDPEIFEQELEKIFHKTWIYVGHESQVKNPGDYATTQIGKQPMIMVRGKDGQVNVLYNRCPHRGAMLCNEHMGHAGKTFMCSYHGWQFHLDGQVYGIPSEEGYEQTRLCAEDPAKNIKPAPRVENYRGFVFASLAEDGPDLESHLGGAKQAFDDMCDRAPEGEVEVVPNCFRMIQKSNWKIFLENQLDALHPSVTHGSTGHAAAEVEKEIKSKTGEDAPLSYHYLSAFTTPIHKWDSMETVGYPQGHCLLQGYMGLRPQDPDTLEYEAVMREHYGAERTEEILSVNIHHVLVYPCLSVQSPLQQLRAVRPLAPDRTLTEIWHFRLKGAPEAIYRRALDYYYLVNSPSTMVNADDLYNFWRCHQGLRSEGGEWVSFHRNAGQDPTENGVTTSVTGLSEMPMRNMFSAWTDFMAAR
ncbi:MAG: Rieske 2Fe-2S domain-containing protein [Alphaproteobacteria bacterium]|nr:Rieske 2Fe-2S domain-containing protein [Alphaproteobacteria bacterium]